MNILAYLRKKFKTNENRVIFKNTLALIVLFGARYILPLLTFPYLSNTLENDNYGRFKFALALILYFEIIVEYGFNVPATRSISKNRENKQLLSYTINSIWIIKSCLIIGCFSFLVALLLLVNKFGNDWLLYICFFPMIIGQALASPYFFQGMERMKFITYLNIAGYVFYTIMLFLLVKSKGDLVLAAFLQGSYQLLVGIGSLIVIKKNFNIRLVRPPRDAILHELKEGTYLFAHTIAYYAYSSSAILILGLFAPDNIVGDYAFVATIITATQGIQNAVMKSVFPRMSKLAAESKTSALNFMRKVLVLTLAFTLVICACLFFFGGWVIEQFMPIYTSAIPILQIQAFIPAIICVSSILGHQLLLAFDMKTPYIIIMILACCVMFPLSFIVVPIYSSIGLSWIIVSVELIVAVTEFIYLCFKGFNIFKGITKTFQT